MKLNQTVNYSFLGVNIDEENRQECEADKRIAKYNSSVWAFYPLLKEKYIPRKCKLEIYRTILKPILLYGAESWALNTRAKSKLQGEDMRVLRATKGVTQRDRGRNLDVRREQRVEPLQGEMERIQLRWYGHVMRMADNRLPRKYLLWQPSVSRPVSRPRKCWTDGIRGAIEKRGDTLTVIEESQKYLNRQEWREFSRRPTSWQII